MNKTIDIIFDKVVVVVEIKWSMNEIISMQMNAMQDEVHPMKYSFEWIFLKINKVNENMHSKWYITTGIVLFLWSFCNPFDRRGITVTLNFDHMWE